MSPVHTLLFGVLLLLSPGTFGVAEPFSMFSSKNVFNRGLATNNSLLAPCFHNISAGAAWVFPTSSYDLGARGMSCQCFDPDQTCCMPKSSSVAPFCISQNSTCCADTYCNSGEKCCGDACCPSETTCTVTANSTGCCPFNTTCSGPPTCSDYSAPDCSDPFLSPQQCCPSGSPYCRSFAPYGLGCFVSSTFQAAVVQPSTSTQTVTLVFSPLGSGRFTLEIPTQLSKTSQSSSVVVVTSYEINVLPTSTLTSTPTSTSTSVLSTTTSMSTSRHGISVAPSSSASALCFDPNLQKPLPCSITSSAPTSALNPNATASTFNYSPPGASTLNSQASSSMSRIWSSLDWFTCISLVVFIIFVKLSANQVRPCTRLLDSRAREMELLAEQEQAQGTAQGVTQGRRHIRLVSGSARPLSASYERELRLMQL